MSKRLRIILNMVIMQVAWFTCVLSGARGLSWPALVVGISSVIIHVRLTPDRTGDLMLILSAIGVGLIADTQLVAIGAMSFPAFPDHPTSTTTFMLVLWAVFATTLPVSMGWLQERYLTGAAVGCISGTLAYLAGAKLGAVAIHQGITPIAVMWAIALPLLLLIQSSLKILTSITPTTAG